MIINTDFMADIKAAAQHLLVPVPVLQKMIDDDTAPEYIIVKKQILFSWDDLDDFIQAHTICKDGSVIDKVTAKILGYRKHEFGCDLPVLACYHKGYSENGERLLHLVDLHGNRRSHGGGYEFGEANNTSRFEGYFLEEVTDPELAGLSEKYTGHNAL